MSELWTLMAVELNWMQGLVHLIISMSTYANGLLIKHEMLQTVGLSFLTILLSQFLFYFKFYIPSQFHFACEINHTDQYIINIGNSSLLVLLVFTVMMLCPMNSLSQK